MAGLAKPILDELRPELDFIHKPVNKGHLNLDDLKPIMKGSFAEGADAQEIHFTNVTPARQFCLECLDSFDGGPFAAMAELDILDGNGKSIPHLNWTVAYVDSEEVAGEDGSASNAINGQTSDFWHTEWSKDKPGYPHYLVIDLGESTGISGFRYTPRAGAKVKGRIKDYRIYLGDGLASR